MPSKESIQSREPPRYRPLLWVACAAALGIALDRWLDGAVGLYLWWTFAVALVVLCHVWHRRQRFGWSCIALLASIAALAGTWRHYYWNYADTWHLTRYAAASSAPMCVEAVIVDRVRWIAAPPPHPLRALPAPSRSETTVELVRIRDGAEWQPAAGRARLRVDGTLTGFEEGDVVRIFGQFGRPLSADNPGQFDWAKLQRGRGLLVDLFAPEPACIASVPAGERGGGVSLMGGAVRWCEYQLTKYFGPAESDLELALVLGTRSDVDDDVYDAFLRTGTVHLLVVSGLHVGFLAGLVWLLVRVGLVSRRWGVPLSALAVLVYLGIVGGQSPVVRSTVLVLLGLWMLSVGRRPSTANLLAAAALVVLAWNPNELFRGGAQLSFLCVAVLSWYTKTILEHRRIDPLTRLIRETQRWPRRLARHSASWFSSMCAVSFVMFLATAPLVAYHYNIASPVSIFLTPLVWPLVAVALVTGFAVCTFGWLVPAAGYALGSAGSLALEATTAVVQYADSFPIGHFYSPGPHGWWLLVFYALLAVFALAPSQFNGKLQLAALALWIAAGLGVATWDRTNDRLECSFLAVGHGTCVVIEMPSGQTLLYDAGSLGSPEGAAQTVASFLWSRGITEIDAVVLSHADIDHYNALPALAERFPIDVVYVSPLMFDPWATDGQLTGPNFLREQLTAAGVPLREVWMNDRLQTGDSAVTIDVLHPPRTGVAGRDNANSVLLWIEFAGQSILLPGDLESPGIEAVMADPAQDCDILLAPHHGSANSDPPGFAAWCSPEWVVISGGDHTAATESVAHSYRSAGAQVVHTADLGAARFTLGRDRLTASTFHGGALTE